MNKQLTIFTLVLSMLAMLSAALPAQAAATVTRTVCGGALCDFATIQAAIDVSSDGDTIFVNTGVHSEAGIFVDKDLTIKGLGSSITYVEAAANVGLSTNRVFEIAPNATVTLQALTVRHGVTPDGTFFVTDGGSGGGILNRGHLTLNDVVVSDNQTGRGFDCGTDGCTAGNGGDGGGIYNAAGAHLIVIRSTIDSNHTGDGADCAGMPCNLGRSGHGAGIYSMGSLQITKSTLYANRNGAAGFCNSNACFTNDVDLGGAVYNGNYAFIRNSTLHYNVASNGGGVATISGAETSLDNVTITNNIIRVIFQKAGGVYNENRTFISNSIVADNSSDQCGGSAGVAASAANLSSDGSCTGFTQSSTLANLRGVDTYFSGMLIDPPDWDSPALDAGTNCELTDQRGFLRVPNGGECDLGAYEKLVESSCSTVAQPLDDNSLFFISDDITISRAGTVIDVAPRLTITHPFVGDLIASMGYNGTTIRQVVDRPGHPTSTNGCDGDDVAATFFDGATRVAEDTCAAQPALFDDLKPNQSFGDYAGNALAATWRMSVRDADQGAVGTFEAWCMVADYAPTVSAETITQFTVSASQPRIGPNDSFYFRVDIITGSNGWDGFDPDLLTFEADVTDSDGGNVTSGTPIVPVDSNIDCAKPGGIGQFFRCGGDGANESLAADETYTFYFPYTNTDNGSTDGCDSGWVTGWLRDTNLTPLDAPAWPECVTVSQGSTYPPAQSAPTAIGLDERGVANSAEITPVLPLATLLLTSIFLLIRKRQITALPFR